MSTSLDLSTIIAEKIGVKNYFKEEFPKNQIYISHTASHPHPSFAIKKWVGSPYKVANCFAIAGKPYPSENYYNDGQIHQCFNSKYWAIHLGLHAKRNEIPLSFKKKEVSRILEKHSISIALCNAGALSWESGRFYSSFRKVIDEEDVIEYMETFRGNRFYHRYTQAQIDSLKNILLYLNELYGIPLEYKSEIWDISKSALEGEKGIFTKCSVRSDVGSCHPQPELIEMLLSLKR